MRRKVQEWFGATPDAKIPPRVRLRVFEAYEGKCPKCGRRLEPNRWECDHIEALINGGEHREGNLQPLCLYPCHSTKTGEDIKEKSVIYRKRLKHSGIKKPRRITAWRLFDGTIKRASKAR